MGAAAGNNKQKKTFFSLASLFKLYGQKASIEETWTAKDTVGGDWRDEEKRYWPVPEPGIDRKASAFIDKFHAQLAS